MANRERPSIYDWQEGNKIPPADQHACRVCTHSERLFLPLPRGQVRDLLEATGEVPKCQTQLAVPAPFGDLNLQSMAPSKNYIASETSTQLRIINTMGWDQGN